MVTCVILWHLLRQFLDLSQYKSQIKAQNIVLVPLSDFYIETGLKTAAVNATE